MPKPKAERRRPGRARLAGSHAIAPGSIDITAAQGCVKAVLNRPRARNRISAAMAAVLIELAEKVEDDDSARMLSITGAGRRDFCAGFDSGVDPALVESLAALSKPTLAIINGDAIDEGLELALALDLRAAKAGVKLALTQLRRGALPRFGGTQRLPRLGGASLALRMMLTGQSISAEEAMRAGVVTYLGAAGERGLIKVAAEVTDALLTRAPLAARLAKEAVRKGYDMTLEQGIRLEEDLYALLQTTADRQEGVRAFLEKRKPLFRGV